MIPERISEHFLRKKPVFLFILLRLCHGTRNPAETSEKESGNASGIGRTRRKGQYLIYSV